MNLLNLGITAIFGIYVGTLAGQGILTFGQAAMLVGIYILRVCTATILRAPDEKRGSV